ncbi:MAG: UbiX family flavin prenyltransferase [Bacteroidetes bacterium]|nr:UbiX family flavin prenyltransferase [Bacteroidota bacterium]
MEKHKLILAITGASGAIYAKDLIKKLQIIDDQLDECCLIFSDVAKQVWEYELEEAFPNDFYFPVIEPDDFFSPVASGSAGFNKMIVCPCSMGTLGRIAAGIADELIARAADVILKENKTLLLVPRETPFNKIHIENISRIANAGGIIMPAMPGFYSKPLSIHEMVSNFTDRVLSVAGFSINGFKWGYDPAE